MSNKAHTTGIMLVTRIIKALNRRKSHRLSVPATRGLSFARITPPER
ncbi:hypothetical protein Y88_3003 [Novosphingobium nitrogenifigens DSM 19370]|uniref:Uncharacterized protein n=1 Tax=Novosphingobium nitrogenifigens DSM 19370 TaxID=983920 RepID=F1ZCB6_9SPHN|nr:hypothetical protein Y88_3003 [Novosphingobium nitrogenifigens DSM 19370]